MQDVLEEIVGDRARPSGGVNTQITSDSAPILRRILTGGELRDGILIWGIKKKWMYRLLNLHSSVYCSIMLTAAGEENLVWIMNVTSRRGRGT